MAPSFPRMLCDLLAIQSCLGTSELCPDLSLTIFAAELVAGPAKGGRGGGLAVILSSAGGDPGATTPHRQGYSITTRHPRSHHCDSCLSLAV